MVQRVTPMNFQPVVFSQPCADKAVVVRVPLSFDGSGEDIEVDFSALQATGHFDAAQTIFLDNHANAAVVTVTMNQSYQTFQVPIGGFTYMPVLQPTPPKITFNCTAAIDLYVHVINFFLPPVIWGPTIGGGGGGGVTGLTPFDDSGTIAAANTPQIAIAANISRAGFLISNPRSETETLKIRFGATGGEIDLAPGATYETGAIFWKGDIYVEAATMGHAFTAYEGT